ncbi:putative efflux system component YknX [Oxobacter pfennigii]|uniref:Putative efflux system component YknX n=1 Tax=Oxobacter pfennigii TaxID=36849 RepID=A0A0P9ALI4_9CLOT|nr:biotin/lipoyl-binding protein [Oxobacter pfennigii]KPU46222.1 putative efflux system component YknX [Oxobacter pfennigii]
MKPGLKNETGIVAAQKNVKINKWVIILILLAAAALAAVVLLSNPKPLSVMEGTASKNNLARTIVVTGYIEAEESENHILDTTQKVVDVFVKEGDDVKKGTVLAQLDTTDLEYQLKRAVINYDTARENLNNTSVTSDNSIKQAEINLEKAKSDYEDLKKKFEANQSLYDSGYISKFDYDASKKAFSDAENQVEYMEIQLENAKRNSSEVSQKSQRDLSNTEIENLNKKIADSTITADMDGRVVKFDIVKNEYPNQDNNTIIVCDPASYKVEVEVNQYDAVKIKTGQKAVVKIKGVDKEYSGTVSKIGELAEVKVSGGNKESRIYIDVLINDIDESIRIGYEVDVDIILDEVTDVVSVGLDSIKTDADGQKYVFVAEGGKAVKRFVKTGFETDFDAEVTEGLKAGDKYILNPGNSLKEGDIIKTSL